MKVGMVWPLDPEIVVAFARGATAVVTIDGDGQHAASDIPRLVAAHRRSPRAIVLCARTRSDGPRPALRRFANGFADFWISWACGLRVLDYFASPIKGGDGNREFFLFATAV